MYSCLISISECFRFGFCEVFGQCICVFALIRWRDLTKPCPTLSANYLCLTTAIPTSFWLTTALTESMVRRSDCAGSWRNTSLCRRSTHVSQLLVVKSAFWRKLNNFNEAIHSKGNKALLESRIVGLVMESPVCDFLGFPLSSYAWSSW